MILARAGPDYAQEDVVWQAWGAILGLYFPSTAPPGQRYYAIDRERYRGVPPAVPSAVKPDLVVVRMHEVVNPPNPPANQYAPNMPDIVSRDVLWVECKAPNHDAPASWNTLIFEAAGRLAHAHPRRMLFLIVAVGLKWMIFKWDPSSNQPLQLQAHNVNDVWNVHPFVSYDSTIAGQRHVVPRTNPQVADTIDTRRAYSLDFWTVDQTTGQPRNMPACQLLERCLRHIQATHFVGDNPDLFH